MLEHGMMGKRLALTNQTGYDIFNDGSGTALYKFENNGLDERGLYNCTVGGTPTYATGAMGNAYVVSETNTLTTPNIPTGNIRAISLWAYPTALPTSLLKGLYCTQTTIGQAVFIGYVSAGVYYLEVYFNVNGTRYYTTTNPQTTLVLDTWTNLVFVLETGNTISVYKDGVPIVQSTPTTSGSISYTGQIMMGRYPTATYPFIGRLDQFRIFNRPITAAEAIILATET